MTGTKSQWIWGIHLFPNLVVLLLHLIIQEHANWGSCSHLIFRDDWKFLGGLLSMRMAFRVLGEGKGQSFPPNMNIEIFSVKLKFSNRRMRVIFLFLWDQYLPHLFEYQEERSASRKQLEKNMKQHRKTIMEESEVEFDCKCLMFCLGCKETKNFGISKQKRPVSSAQILFSLPKMQ